MLLRSRDLHDMILLPCHTLRDISSQVTCQCVTADSGPAHRKKLCTQIIHCTMETQQDFFWNTDKVESFARIFQNQWDF